MPEARIFDLHCDTLDLLAWPMLDEELRAGHKRFSPEDLERVPVGDAPHDFGAGGFHLGLNRLEGMDWVQCLAVYVFDTLTPEQQRRFFERVASTLPMHVAAHPGRLAICRTVDEAETALAEGQLAGILTIEGAGLLATGDDAVELIDEAGVRMVTLTWNAPSPLGSGHDSHAGLTELGRHRIRELEERRIAVDVSHLNDEGFSDLLEVVRRPFAASHSNSRAVRDVPRNLTDDQFRAIRDAGGIAGINYCKAFVADGGAYSPEQLFAHIDHWLDLDGADTVALGSDFDGCDIPEWLGSCEKAAALAPLMAERYGAETADKICYANAARFFREIERG